VSVIDLKTANMYCPFVKGFELPDRTLQPQMEQGLQIGFQTSPGFKEQNERSGLLHP